MIAEDDLFMADMLGIYLAENGYEVCGIAATVEEGVTLGERHKPDLALLDIRLAEGGHAREIAARLKRQGRTGILYATGNNGTLGPLGLSRDDGDAFLGKPFRPADLLRALQIVEQIVSTGVASEPFPERFHILEPSFSPSPPAASSPPSHK